jgi:hypothetical protein
MTWLAQLFLVMTSIAPIVFVYAASIVGRNSTFALWLFLVVAVFVVVCKALLVTARAYVETEPKAVASIAGLEKEPLAFLVAYALPVVTAAAKPDNGDPLPGALALLAFLFVMTLLVWQQQLFYVNPVAAMLGYHFHSAACPTGETVLVVSKRKTLPKGTLTVAVLSEYLWLDVF